MRMQNKIKQKVPQAKGQIMSNDKINSQHYTYISCKEKLRLGNILTLKPLTIINIYKKKPPQCNIPSLLNFKSIAIID